MLYVVDVMKVTPSFSKYSAWSKAPSDVIKTLVGCGANLCVIKVPQIVVIGNLIGVLYAIYYALSFECRADVYIQNYGRFINVLVFFAKIKHVKIHYIVHDLTYLRLGVRTSELNLLKKMDEVIVHTDSMKMHLMENGLNVPMKVLWLFDYYSKDDFRPIEFYVKSRLTVAFAGNLKKSFFLYDLQNLDKGNLTFQIYGLEPSWKLKKNGFFCYKGFFLPDNVSFLDAGWGLVWDGDAVDGCKGLLGEYLKYNSSHKVSLYLAAGIPIIIWHKSAMADWLKSEGVALLVENLNELPMMLNAITDEEYICFLYKARELGSRLKKGEFLKKCIEI